MRVAAVFLAAALPLIATAQTSERRDDPDRSRVEVTGCVKGSTLTETNLHMPQPSVPVENPARRWRIRASKALMRQLKEHAGNELRIVGTTKNPRSGYVLGAKRIGQSRIYIGGNVNKSAAGARDPLPEPPTIDVETFEATGTACR